MLSHILTAIPRKVVIYPVVVVLLLVIISLLDFPQSRPSAKPALPGPLALCAKPRARIDLVLPPVDFVPTKTANALIGGKFKFEVAFDNIQGNGTGYGPYLDVIFPASGIDGPPIGPFDGVSFDQSNGSGASYLGSPIQPGRITLRTFPSSGTVSHPFSNLIITGAPGDQLVVIELPFGSYTPQQPPAGIIVNALVSNLADIGDPLTIRVQAGFRYGCSPTGNSPALVSVPIDNDQGIVTPVLFAIDKTYDGPEIGPKTGETATGPNFPHSYTIAVNVAPGQTVTNLKVTDLLPNNLAFKNLTSFFPVNGVPGPLPPVGVAANNSTLTVVFPSVTGGTSGLPDVLVTFEFFIPEKDASGASILNPTTGASAVSINNDQVEGMWTPLDPRDSGGVEETDGPAYTLVCKSIALQKSGINTSKGNVDVAAPTTDNGPGDVIRYTLAFQVSDFFTFNQLNFQDLLSDGQTFQSFIAPTFTAMDKTQNLSGNFTAANFNFMFSCTNKAWTINFNLSGAMVASGGTGTLTGGFATSLPPQNIGAKGTIAFNARIAEDYICSVPSGDQSVDQNDKLSNQATITGTILDNSTLLPIGQMTDDGAVAFRLLIGSLSKSIYARTDRFGNKTLNPSPGTVFAPGDLITFRLRYDLRHGDVEKFSIQDFLPMPVFDLNLQPIQGPPSSCFGAGTPPTGHYCFGPNNTLPFVGGRPTLSFPGGNSVRFDYNTFDDPTSLAPPNNVIELLFTLTIQNDPFVDGLFLTNQIQSSETNSFNETTTEVTIGQFLVAEPNVRIRKGVVKTDNGFAQFSPAVTPAFPFSAPITSTILANANAINSNLSNVDAGDSVTFVTVVENLGSSPYGAFDVKISDTPPTGFIQIGTFTVTDGNLNPLSFTGTPASFFTPAGIDLIDPSATAGSLGPFNLTNGKNIAVITYTLKMPFQVAPCQAFINTTNIRNYSSTDMGPNYASSGYGGPFTDTAAVTIAGPTISKALASTNQPFTLASNVTIGEEVTYTFSVTLPEGVTPSLTVTDLVPAGLQVLSVGSIVTPYPVSILSTSPTLPAACGASVAINFVGPITVPADNNPFNNSFTFQLIARVCNVPGNVGFVGSQTILSNSAILTAGSCSSSSNAVPVTVVEPQLKITKQFMPNLVLPNTTTQIKLVVTNIGTSPAFDVTVTDTLPTANFTGILPVVSPPGWAGLFNNTTVTYTSTSGVSIPPNGTVTFVFSATVKPGCGVVTNIAKITHATTLPGVFNFERDEPPVSGSAGLIVQGPGCPCVAEPQGMVDWWPFDETAGPTATDIRGSVNNLGTYGAGTASPTPTPGVVKNGLCFDGVNDYVEVADNPEVNFLGGCVAGGTSESLTIDVWVKTSANTGLQVILDKRTNPGAVGYHFFLLNGLLGFQMNGANFVEPASGPNVADGQWHLVAVSVARCFGAASLYVDGNVVLTFPQPMVNINNTGKLQIGRRDPAFGASYFNGCLDELEIFKRALSAAEIQSIYAAGSGGKCKATGCTTPSFAPAQNYLAHTLPNSLAAVDINGDGKLDLAVVNQSSSDVSFLMGPTFAPPANHGIGSIVSNVNGLAVGSFNSVFDTNPDVAVITYLPNPDTVRVLTSPGYGVSQTLPLAGLAPQPIRIAAGQFNTSGVGSDNFADLAVTNFTAETVVALKGNGNGTFTTGQTINLTSHGPIGLIASKFIDGSGFDNLMVAGFASGKVIVLKGNGNGTFTIGASFNSGNPGNKPFALTAADFNHDQKLDLAVANSTGNNVAVFAGDGTGQFTLSGIFPVGNAPRSVAAADFNCDGQVDLVVANALSGTVSVLLGNGLGGFGAKTDFAAGAGAATVVVGDFNGDGKQDIATANPQAGNVSILFNTCDCQCFLQGVTLQPVSKIICPLDSATFTAAAIGSPSPSVQWQVSTDGGLTWTNITGATSGSLTVSGPAGLYRAVFTNSCGTAISNSASLGYAFFPCFISFGSQVFPHSGGSGSVNVTTPEGTNWTAVSNVAWITITSGSSGIGPGSVYYTVAADDGGKPRTGTMTIAGKTFTVMQ